MKKEWFFCKSDVFASSYLSSYMFVCLFSKDLLNLSSVSDILQGLHFLSVFLIFIGV